MWSCCLDLVPPLEGGLWQMKRARGVLWFMAIAKPPINNNNSPIANFPISPFPPCFLMPRSPSPHSRSRSHRDTSYRDLDRPRVSSPTGRGPPLPRDRDRERDRDRDRDARRGYDDRDKDRERDRREVGGARRGRSRSPDRRGMWTAIKPLLKTTLKLWEKLN